MEGTNFIFYPSFQQNRPGDWEICSPQGWELAPNKHRGCGWISHGREGAPSTQFRAHSGCRFPSSLKAYPQGVSAVMELTHKGGPLACWEGGVCGGVENTCRGGRMTE